MSGEEQENGGYLNITESEKMAPRQFMSLC
jgi:hypothetical protein